MKIGFIGQGWVGKNMADEFEERERKNADIIGMDPLYEIVRYSLEEPYVRNARDLLNCEYVFVAVPTPTYDNGQYLHNIYDVLKLLGPQTVVIIKSTIQPGTTVELQETFPDLIVMHSPEFLTEKNVQYDVRNPNRNIIGIPKNEEPWISSAQQVMHLLPTAKYELVTDSVNAEIIKYAGNAFLLTKVLFTNMLYDLVKEQGGDWSEVREAWTKDPRIGKSHTKVFDEDGKRGAAGHCLLKDFEVYASLFNNKEFQSAVLHHIRAMNLGYLITSKKDLDIVNDIYGYAISDVTKEFA